MAFLENRHIVGHLLFAGKVAVDFERGDGWDTGYVERKVKAGVSSFMDTSLRNLDSVIFHDIFSHIFTHNGEETNI
jgi:hypothetical protein